jgi:hypothetical protein
MDHANQHQIRITDFTVGLQHKIYQVTKPDGLTEKRKDTIPPLLVHFVHSVQVTHKNRKFVLIQPAVIFVSINGKKSFHYAYQSFTDITRS